MKAYLLLLNEISNNTTAKLRTAAEMNLYESAIILSVGDECIDINCHSLRLLELGFTPGQEVKLIAKSPFKEPLAFSVRGTVIALRRNEAKCIKI